MQFSAYVDASSATAIYPDNFALIYPALGLAGESAEVLDALPRGNRGDVLKELGDVAWYMAAICRDAAIDPLELEVCTIEVSAAAVGVGLVSAAGKVAEQVKKTVRSGSTSLPPERREVIIAALASMLALLERAAYEHYSDLGQVLDMNLAKLTDRADRNVLHGDGDHR